MTAKSSNQQIIEPCFQLRSCIKNSGQSSEVSSVANGNTSSFIPSDGLKKKKNVRFDDMEYMNEPSRIEQFLTDEEDSIVASKQTPTKLNQTTLARKKQLALKRQRDQER
jgi:hypothetical protein